MSVRRVLCYRRIQTTSSTSALPRQLDRGTDKTPTPNLTAINGRIHKPKGNDVTEHLSRHATGQKILL
ncbi:hypothetical protein HZ326_18128 [Fusarium oxysporum f. sp. albedinis]|nr:hypothetical protein HZ326_18128 [Fusarium oxysporum f. sp. albedinis]